MEKEKKWLTYDSTIGELYNSPVGHDALVKVLLQTGLPEKVITNKAGRKKPDSQTGNAGGRNKAKNGI